MARPAFTNQDLEATAQTGQAAVSARADVREFTLASSNGAGPPVDAWVPSRGEGAAKPRPAWPRPAGEGSPSPRLRRAGAARAPPPQERPPEPAHPPPPGHQGEPPGEGRPPPP